MPTGPRGGAYKWKRSRRTGRRYKVYGSKGGGIVDTVVDTGKALFGGSKGKVHNSINTLDDDRKHHAFFAHAAYDPKRKEVLDYDRMDQHSTNDVSFYKQRGKNQYVIGIRGTQLKGSKQSISDLKSDLAVLRNKGIERVSTVQPLIERFLRANPNAKVNITGHSLGGSTSMQVFDNLKKKHKQLKKNYAFNPGVSTVALARGSKQGKNKMKQMAKDSRQVITVMDNDPVSKSIKAYNAKNLATVKGAKGPLAFKNHAIANLVDASYHKKYMDKFYNKKKPDLRHVRDAADTRRRKKMREARSKRQKAALVALHTRRRRV